MNNKAKIVLKEVGLPITGAIVSIFAPFIGIPMAGASGIWSLLDKWREDRANEVKKYIGDEKILDLLKRDDKTRDILYKILFNILQESSFEKRRLYYFYIEQLHKGLRPDFDYHSKVILTINLVTFEELKTLVEFNEKYLDILKAGIEKSKRENPKGKADESKNRGVSLSEIRLIQPFSSENENKQEDEFVNLGNYSLISIKSGRMDGTFYGPLTSFGRVFLDFISEGGKNGG